MIIRPLVLVISFVFLTAGFSPALGQEDSQAKAERLLTQIYSMPNFPARIHDVKIIIDQTEKGYAYYVREPKRFFGLKKSKIPEIHISARFMHGHSDEAVLVTLAHELGHDFDIFGGVELYFETEKPLNRLLRERKQEEERQYFAEAFALYVLGEDLYKKGRLDFALTSIKEQHGAYWLYIETSSLLLQYYTDQAELWVNYSTEVAKSGLDEVEKLVKLVNGLFLNSSGSQCEPIFIE